MTVDKALSIALQKALGFEQKGQRMYQECAKGTKNPLVARTFHYLAQQEVYHIKEIEGYMSDERIELGGDTAEETQRFFDTTVKEFAKKTELSADDVQAYERAMELEHSAYDFYKLELSKVSDARLKRFFKFLMDQENMHYMMAKKGFEFASDPKGFFAGEEDWLFEG